MRISMEISMIFIDTGPFIARYLEKDQFHHQAVDFWSLLEQQGSERFVTIVENPGGHPQRLLRYFRGVA